MSSFRLKPAWVAVCAVVLLGGGAQCDDDLFGNVGEVFDAIGRGLSVVGGRAGSLIGADPGIEDVGTADFTGLVVDRRHFEQRYPVHPGASVSISSEFGKIQVEAWDNPVVEVRGETVVGAETADMAERILEAIDTHVDASENSVSVRTILPDTRYLGKVALEVNYTVMAPKDIALVCENTLGDISVRGIDGAVSVKAVFGVVDLRDIGSPVRVWSRGEFPVRAQGLRAGGAFALRGSRAEFRDISGSLTVTNYSGTVRISELGSDADVDVTSHSGPIFLELAAGAPPALEVSVLFGTIDSDIRLRETSRGRLTIARTDSPDATRRVALSATFDDVIIRSAALEADPRANVLGETKSVKRVLDEDMALGEGVDLVVDAMVGDVRIEGIDEDHIYVTATHTLRLRPDATTRDAEKSMDALDVRLELLGDRLLVRTSARDDITEHGCIAYRADLVIRCPRTTSVKVQARNGYTELLGTGAAVTIEQMQGVVAVEHAKGELDITNHQGEVRVTNSAGPVKISAAYGPATVTNVFGYVSVSCEEGKTVIDGAQAGILVRNRGGDVRIIAMSGVGGDYDVLAEQGNVSIVLPPSADVSLLATATNGIVRSAIPMTGGIEKDRQTFQARLNDGRYRVSLEARGGNVLVD